MVMQPLVTIEGNCHCGNMSYTLRWPVSSPEIPVRECGCTFCRKHGGAWTSHQQSVLQANVRNSLLVSKYKFGTETAEFYVCTRCGVVPFVISSIDSHLYAVVNTNTFGDKEKLRISCTHANFDGEDLGDRLERRTRNWIANVRIAESG
jgi:hypothetical protein